jgi:hypothetical protein
MASMQSEPMQYLFEVDLSQRKLRHDSSSASCEIDPLSVSRAFHRTIRAASRRISSSHTKEVRSETSRSRQSKSGGNIHIRTCPTGGKIGPSQMHKK